MIYIVPLDAILWPSGYQGQYKYSEIKKEEFVHQVGKKKKTIIGTAVLLGRFSISLRQTYLALHANVTRIDLRVKWRDVPNKHNEEAIFILR